MSVGCMQPVTICCVIEADVEMLGVGAETPHQQGILSRTVHQCECSCPHGGN